MPDTHRHHGDPFNLEYELWVRESTGGPADREYRVEHGDELAWFDASVVDVRGGQPAEVLIDAKGRYSRFIDAETGRWREWWRNSEKGGLDEMTSQAERQVRVANGRTVEWWCAEKSTARAFRREFQQNPQLSGRIRVVHRPMPGREG